MAIVTAPSASFADLYRRVAIFERKALAHALLSRGRVKTRTSAVILVASLLSGCTHDPLAVCKATTPTSYACTTYDGGVSPFVSVSIATTDLEDGYFPREPSCLFSGDGGVGAISFDQPFCRSTPLDAFGEDLRHVNVCCQVPEGRWTLTGTDGFPVVVERTDAGLVCTL